MVYRLCFLPFLSLFLWNWPSNFPPYWVCVDLVTMSCCFQSPRQWCWCFRPPVLRFLVIFFSPHRPTHPKPGNLFDAKRTKRGWPKPYGFSFGLPHHIASACFCILVFCFVLFFFVGKINWNCTKTLNIPFGGSRTRIKKKWKTRWFIDRKGNGVGLGLVTALRFTSALSNGPDIQNEKWLRTDYSRLDIKHLLRWDLSPLPVHGVDSRCWR